MEIIRSGTNPALQRVRAVAAGNEDGILLLEGDHLLDEARAAGLAIELVLVSAERAELAEELRRAGLPVRIASADLIQRASGLVHSPGVLALARPPERGAAEILGAKGERLVCAAAGIADPGNLGALARTAEAAGAAALVLAGGCSPTSPKALRGSMGSLLRLPVLRFPGPPGDEAPAARASAALEAAAYRQVLAATRGGRAHADFDWSGRLALWLGPETGALPAALADLPAVSIPLAGRAESLNVGAAAAVLLFAAAAARAKAGR